MTTYVCIPQSKNNDPNYRYKMPQMKLRQESRLNGVKVNITNLPDVARALRVPESSILKFFSVEVGASSEGESIIKGQHSLNDLSQKLDKFIHKYVLCSECKLPEITYTVEKKNLAGTCRSCGKVQKLDVMHKAGKRLKNDLPAYMAANPVPDIKPTKNPSDDDLPQGPAQGAQGGGNEQERLLRERAEKLEATGGEVSRLDAAQVTLTDEQIVGACDELKQFVEEKEGEELKSNEILQQVRHSQLQLNITPEFKFYICLCGIFGPHRNIIKKWDDFEAVFTNLVEQDEENGKKHFFQAIIQFFVNRYPEQQKLAQPFCKKLYDNGILEEDFFVKWHAKKLKLDKYCALYDQQAERTMRTVITDFVEWLQNAEYDDEADYGEEATQAEPEEEKKAESAETEAQRNQRLLIEAQKKAQAQQLADARAQGAQRTEKAAAEAKAAAAESELEAIKETTNVAKIEVEDNFDIDDI